MSATTTGSPQKIFDDVAEHRQVKKADPDHSPSEVSVHGGQNSLLTSIHGGQNSLLVLINVSYEPSSDRRMGILGPHIGRPHN
jgi:hypothetical protein